MKIAGRVVRTLDCVTLLVYLPKFSARGRFLSRICSLYTIVVAHSEGSCVAA